MSDETKGKVTIAQAADLAGVKSPQTIRNWADEGLLHLETIDGRQYVAVAELFAVKRIRTNELLQHPKALEVELTRADLSLAAADPVRPIKDARGFYSLQDLDALVAWKSNGATAQIANAVVPVTVATTALATATTSADAVVDEPESQPAPAPIRLEPREAPALASLLDPGARADFWRDIVNYIFGHKDPYKIRPEFWDVRTCPEFIAPAGIFLHYWSPFGFDADEDGGPYQCVYRTAGFVGRVDDFVALPEDNIAEEVDGIEHPPYSDVDAYALHNRRWRETKAAWEDAFYKRRLQLRAAGVDVSLLPQDRSAGRRDRVALIERYHERSMKPCDLPDWYWDTEEEPPFEPPTGAGRFEWGEIVEDPGGAFTYIAASERWEQPMEGVIYVGADPRCDRDPGVHRAPEPLPEEYEKRNVRWRREREAWRQEWLSRRRSRFGEKK